MLRLVLERLDRLFKAASQQNVTLVKVVAEEGEGLVERAKTLGVRLFYFVILLRRDVT